MTEFLEMFRAMLIIGICLIAVAACWRLFGIKGALAALGAIALMLLYRKGRGDGRSEVEKKETKRAQDVIRQADDARTDARMRDADPDRLRVSDGFRRD